MRRQPLRGPRPRADILRVGELEFARGSTLTGETSREDLTALPAYIAVKLVLR